MHNFTYAFSTNIIRSVFLFSLGILLFLPLLTSAFIAPPVSVIDLSLISPKEEYKEEYLGEDTIEGVFTAWNRAGAPVSNLTYKVSFLVKNENNVPLYIVEELSPSDPFTLAASEKRIFAFSYTIPKNILTGTYWLRVSLITIKGIRTGWDDVEVDVRGNDQFILLSQAWLLKNGEEQYPTVGINYSINEPVKVRLNAKNESESSIAVTPLITIYDRTTSGSILKTIEKPLLTLASQESKTLEYDLPLFQQPESYLGELKLIDANQNDMSNRLFFRWVIIGQAAEVISAELPKTEYQQGEEAEVKVQYTGPADIETVGGEATLIAEVYNQLGEKLCQAEKPITIGFGGEETIPCLLSKAVSDPVVAAKIISQETGETLDEYSPVFSPEKRAKLLEEQKANKLAFLKKLGLFGVAGLVIILAIIFLIYRLKKKGSSIALIGLLMIFGATLFFSGVSFVDAAEYEYRQACNAENNIAITWVNPIFDPGNIPTAGADFTVHFRGEIYIPSCMDALVDNTFRFYLTTAHQSPEEQYNMCVADQAAINRRNEILNAPERIYLGSYFVVGQAVVGLTVEYDQTFTVNIPLGWVGQDIWARISYDGKHWDDTRHYNLIASENLGEACAGSPPSTPGLISPFDGEAGVSLDADLDFDEPSDWGKNCAGGFNSYNLYLEAENSDPELFAENLSRTPTIYVNKVADHDGDGSIVVILSRSSFDLADNVIPPGSNVTQLEIGFRFKPWDPPPVTDYRLGPFYRLNGIDNEGNACENFTYADECTVVFPSLNLSLTDLNNLEIGIFIPDGFWWIIKVTQLYVNVSYTIPGGSAEMITLHPIGYGDWGIQGMMGDCRTGWGCVNDQPGNAKWNGFRKETTYYWKVRASNGFFFTDSGVWSFITSLPPTATDLDVTEDNYCGASSPPVRLNWTFPGGTQNGYQIQVDDEPNFNAPLINDSGYVDTDTSGIPGPDFTYPPPGLLFNTTYYWRLMVWDSYNIPSADWIYPPASFATFPQPPDVKFTCNSQDDCSTLSISPEEIVTLTDDSDLYDGFVSRFWDLSLSSGIIEPGFADADSPIKVRFNEGDNQSVILEVTDSNGYSCDATQTLNVAAPLPEWKEIAPTGWLKKFWTSIFSFLQV